MHAHTSFKIVGTNAKGDKYTLNHFSGDNAELSGAHPDDREKATQKLRNRVVGLAAQWGKVFPDDRIEVVESTR